MVELFAAYWPVVLIAVVIGLIVGFLMFRPRQRVRLSDTAPLRPHMATRPDETALGHEAGVTTQHLLDVGQPGPLAAPADDLEQLKGVGPKLAAMLRAHGIARFEQIAGLTETELSRLDQDLGPFRGRLQRDRVIEQAALLARGDTDGFEQRFGKL
jgi:predicted flap endonuclease-1-like 5' DNA nuclease